MSQKRFIAGAIILLLAGLIAACGGGGGSGSGPAYSYLRFAGSDPVTLDPHLVTDVGSHTYVNKIFSGLLKMDLVAVDKDGDGKFSSQETVGAYTQNDLQAVLDQELPVGRAFVSPFVMRGKAIRGLYHLAPDLAESIPDPLQNADGTISYVFELRDASFRNGRQVTAWDFAYSFDRAADPRTVSSTAELYLGDILGVWEMLYDRGYNGKKLENRVYQFSPGEQFDISKEIIDLPGVRVVDAKTLKVTTKNVLPAIFYWHVTYPTSYVVDKQQVDSAPRSWTANPNGTGPYWLEKKDVSQIVLRANSSYYGAQPKIDKVVYSISGGSTLSAYENGEVDISGVGIADIQSVRDPRSAFNDEYFEAVEMSTSYIGLNIRRSPFDDLKVRQAFTMSIDREWLAHTVLADLALPANTILPPGMPGYRQDAQGLSFDPVRARQLLVESKYGGPSGLPRIKLTISGTGGPPSDVLQAVVRMWKENLGVEVTLESIDYMTFLDLIKKGQFQIFSLGWVADYPDPEDFLDLKFHSQRSIANNETGYSNQEVDALLERARVEQDPQKRIALYQKAEDIIIADVPWILLFHTKDVLLVKPYLVDYFPAPMGISTLPYISFGK